MKNYIRTLNVTLIIGVILIGMAVIAITLFGCGDSQDNPIVEDPIAELYNETETPNTVTPKPKTVYDEAYFARIMADRPQMPEILVKGIQIDPNEADKPLHKVIINVDSNNLFNKTPIELDHQFGQPVKIVKTEGNQDPRAHIRYYSIFDNGAAEVFFYDEIVMHMTLYYRRGYNNSLDAVKAAGFGKDKIQLVSSQPSEQINRGAWRAAQDVYSAETNKRVYDQIFVSQTTKSKVWYTVTIKPNIQLVFDKNDNIIEIK